MSKSSELINKLIKDKSIVKQDVFDNTFQAFNLLKEILKETVEGIQRDFVKEDNRIEFYYKEKGKYEAEIKIAGDVIIFYMHTNVFQFDKSSSLWRTSYLKANDQNGFIGTINVYNFLADSFRFQRKNDVGYLIARLFINRENHYMVQGKRQLGFLYNDFINATLSKEDLCEIVNSAILYTLDFNLYTPPFEKQQEVSVEQIQNLSHTLSIATGKRLGFKFTFDDDSIE